MRDLGAVGGGAVNLVGLREAEPASGFIPQPRPLPCSFGEATELITLFHNCVFVCVKMGAEATVDKDGHQWEDVRTALQTSVSESFPSAQRETPALRADDPSRSFCSPFSIHLPSCPPVPTGSP